MNTSKCGRCGYFGNSQNPNLDVNIFEEYNGQTLCSSCRVDLRMKHNDYSNGDKQ